MKVCIIFIAVHLLLITSMVVYQACDEYPGEGFGLYERLYTLKEIHSELELYKKEMGDFPTSIDSLFRYDEKNYQVYFGSKPLHPVPDQRIYVEKIKYQLIDGEPVISDLGDDRKKGGLGADFDVVYPQKYQEPLLFRDFMKMEEFSTFLLYGFLMASGISLCLYGIWRKSLSSGRSWLPLAICCSIVFLLFELFFAQVILLFHIPTLYPHH